MKAIFLGLAASAFAIASPAVAQERNTAGGKIVAGAIIGLDSVKAKAGGISDSAEDALFGVTLGYDYETMKGLVFGVEAEYTDSSLSTTVSEPGTSVTISAGRDLYVGGRLGFRPGRNGVLYAKAGYTNASIEGTVTGRDFALSESVSFDGFRIGAGGEIDLGGNYAIRLEYRYSDYGSLNAFGINTGINVSRNQGIMTLLGKF